MARLGLMRSLGRGLYIKNNYYFCPAGAFSKSSRYGVWLFRVYGLIFAMLRGEMVGIVSHPLGLQDSGSWWEWGRCARFRGKISGVGPPTWSDRCYPNRTPRPCGDPGCRAGWIPRGHCMHTECLAGPQCFPAGPHAVHGWI